MNLYYVESLGFVHHVKGTISPNNPVFGKQLCLSREIHREQTTYTPPTLPRPVLCRFHGRHLPAPDLFAVSVERDASEVRPSSIRSVPVASREPPENHSPVVLYGCSKNFIVSDSTILRNVTAKKMRTGSTTPHIKSELELKRIDHSRVMCTSYSYKENKRPEESRINSVEYRQRDTCEAKDVPG